MARSRRRAKKARAPVRVGLPGKRRAANRLPKAQTLILPNKETVVWDVEGTLSSNYAAAGFTLNPNAAASAARCPDAAATSDDATCPEEPEELQVTLGKRRKAGAATPRVERLTRMQRTHVSCLVARHGLDFKAMARDLKRNRLQHTAGALRFLCARYLEHEPCPANVTPEQRKELLRGNPAAAAQ